MALRASAAMRTYAACKLVAAAARAAPMLSSSYSTAAVVDRVVMAGPQGRDDALVARGGDGGVYILSGAAWGPLHGGDPEPLKNIRGHW